MSIKEIKNQLKSDIDALSATDAKLALKDLNDYFNYLQYRREMPKNIKLSFIQYQQLKLSLQQAAEGKLQPSSKVFSQLKKKYAR